MLTRFVKTNPIKLTKQYVSVIKKANLDTLKKDSLQFCEGSVFGRQGNKFKSEHEFTQFKALLFCLMMDPIDYDKNGRFKNWHNEKFKYENTSTFYKTDGGDVKKVIDKAIRDQNVHFNYIKKLNINKMDFDVEDYVDHFCSINNCIPSESTMLIQTSHVLNHSLFVSDCVRVYRKILPVINLDVDNTIGLD